LKEVNKDNTMPRDGGLQQYTDSTPQTRGTRRRKIRNEEERNARPVKRVQTIKHLEGNTTAEKGLHIIEIFPSPDSATYMILIVTAMLMLDSKTLTSSAIHILSSR
jgi:hypothetical protein